MQVVEMTQSDFVLFVFSAASKAGYKTYVNKNGLKAIDFGHKQIHEKHIEDLFPDILYLGADISSLIDKVAPGRPCSHKPMKNIIACIQKEKRGCR